MGFFKSNQDKLLTHRIERQSKPFVDQNLQFHLPGVEDCPTETSTTYYPVYSHYSKILPIPSYLPPEINEEDLNHAVREIESSFQAWKKMQKKLKSYLPETH